MLSFNKEVKRKQGIPTTSKQFKGKLGLVFNITIGKEKTNKDVPEKIDTISMYVATDISSMLVNDIIAQKPRRIIFNPGAENPELTEKAKAANILPINACTLVMLKTNQFY